VVWSGFPLLVRNRLTPIAATRPVAMPTVGSRPIIGLSGTAAVNTDGAALHGFGIAHGARSVLLGVPVL
jgi:hypothetical protein